MPEILQDYRPEWASAFLELKTMLGAALGDVVIEIHHVGSTAIPGMVAKAILDIDIEISSETPIDVISERLGSIGYTCEGTKGIAGRHALRTVSDGFPKHHLYVLHQGADELVRHLHFRDSLVASSELRDEYAALKQSLKDASPFFARVLDMPPIEARINGAHRLLDDLDRRLSAGEIDEAAWFRKVGDFVTPRYLAADNPRSQSGHSGDDQRWTHARSLIVDAIHRNGTFLDIGCASGYLMECIQRWSRERGFAIEPYGLDISSELADLARRRLPHWADRIQVGNAVDWKPATRFDFVRTGLEYVPTCRCRDLIANLLEHVVAPGGRLIIGTYNEARASIVKPELQATVASWGFTVAGHSSRAHDDTRIAYKVLWLVRGCASSP